MQCDARNAADLLLHLWRQRGVKHVHLALCLSKHILLESGLPVGPKGVNDAPLFLEVGTHTAEPLAVVTQLAVDANLLLERAIVSRQKVVPTAQKERG